MCKYKYVYSFPVWILLQSNLKSYFAFTQHKLLYQEPQVYLHVCTECSLSQMVTNHEVIYCRCKHATGIWIQTVLVCFRIEKSSDQ